MIAKGGWAYILSSQSRCLYIGVTSDRKRHRAREAIEGLVASQEDHAD